MDDLAVGSGFAESWDPRYVSVHNSDEIGFGNGFVASDSHPK